MLPHDIELAAKAMCGDDTNPLLFEQALVIAESEIVLSCVRAESVGVIERLRDFTAIALAKGDNRIALAKAKSREVQLAWAELVPLRAKFDAMTKEEKIKLLEEEERRERESAPVHAPIEERDEFDAMHEAMPDLKRLARYERRAWSRRSQAIRRFIEIKSSQPRAATC
jgi:glycerophosphoryl diester phosphodiesterase